MGLPGERRGPRKRMSTECGLNRRASPVVDESQALTPLAYKMVVF